MEWILSSILQQVTHIVSSRTGANGWKVHCSWPSVRKSPRTAKPIRRRGRGTRALIQSSKQPSPHRPERTIIYYVKLKATLPFAFQCRMTRSKWMGMENAFQCTLAHALESHIWADLGHERQNRRETATMMALKKRSASRYSFCCRMCQVWQAQPKTAHNHHHNKKKKQAKQVIKIYNWHDRKSRQASRTRIAPRFFFLKKKNYTVPRSTTMRRLLSRNANPDFVPSGRPERKGWCISKPPLGWPWIETSRSFKLVFKVCANQTLVTHGHSSSRERTLACDNSRVLPSSYPHRFWNRSTDWNFRTLARKSFHVCSASVVPGSWCKDTFLAQASSLSYSQSPDAARIRD